MTGGNGGSVGTGVGVIGANVGATGIDGGMLAAMRVGVRVEVPGEAAIPPPGNGEKPAVGLVPGLRFPRRASAAPPRTKIRTRATAAIAAGNTAWRRWRAGAAIGLRAGGGAPRAARRVAPNPPGPSGIPPGGVPREPPPKESRFRRLKRAGGARFPAALSGGTAVQAIATGSWPPSGTGCAPVPGSPADVSGGVASGVGQGRRTFPPPPRPPPPRQQPRRRVGGQPRPATFDGGELASRELVLRSQEQIGAVCLAGRAELPGGDGDARVFEQDDRLVILATPVGGGGVAQGQHEIRAVPKRSAGSAASARRMAAANPAGSVDNAASSPPTAGGTPVSKTWSTPARA